jgi:hypothetical protein
MEEIAAHLYGLPPDQFIAARDTRAAEARGRGDGELAGAIKKLRRPTTTAWLANLLVRERRGELDSMVNLGEEMRQAQAALDRDEMRRLSQQRNRVVASLRDAARQLAGDLGKPTGDSSIQELEETLEAAFADAGAAEALRSGRLTTSMRYSGFGPVDVTDAVAAPMTPKGTAPQRARRLQPKTDRSDSRQQRSKSIEAAEHAVRDAQASVSEAERTAEERDRSRQDLRQEQAHRRDLVADLEQQLRALRHAHDQAGVDLRNAEKDYAAAERRVRVAHQRAAKATAVLDEARAANT